MYNCVEGRQTVTRVLHYTLWIKYYWRILIGRFRPQPPYFIPMSNFPAMQYVEETEVTQAVIELDSSLSSFTSVFTACPTSDKE